MSNLHEKPERTAGREVHPRYGISLMRHEGQSGSKRSFWRDNGLTLVALGLFVLCWAGQVYTGLAEYNQDQSSHQQAAVGLGQYLMSGHFWEITMENWESEFLQMGLFVILTSFLFQRGSAESKDPDESEAERQEIDIRPNSPKPARRGGFVLKLYENSLSIALMALFAFTFVMHAIHGARAYSQEQLEHGQAAVSTLHYMGTHRFWFESLQNWQSEFMSVGLLVVLTIYLRQKDSSQSKPVGAPHDKTGDA